MNKGWIKRLLLALAAVAGIAGAGLAIGHSGGLDQYGCHKDHINGGDHCHR